MNSTPSDEHRVLASSHSAASSVSCAVITISDTRTAANDRGGDLITSLLEKSGRRAARRTIVKDDAAAIDAAVRAAADDASIQVILTTGGTGIARRDTTIEVVQRLFASEMPGFGELFRMLSFQEVGAAAMLSRATAGLIVPPSNPSAPGVLLFAMPGSPNAVEVAMTKLILPELSHLVWERNR